MVKFLFPEQFQFVTGLLWGGKTLVLGMQL